MSVSGKDLQSVINTTEYSMSQLKCYLNDRNLLLNSDKTILMKFKCKQSNEINTIGNKFVKDTKFLGLALSNTLSWTKQVEKICHKMSSGIFAIRRLSFFLEINALKSVYYALIHPHISYGIEIYGGTSANNLNKILHLQKVAIRHILHLKNNDSCKDHFINLRIMTVYSLYIYKTILHVKTNAESIPRQQDYHNYNTRNRENFVVKKHNKEKYKQCPTYIGIKFINNLPGCIKNENSFNNFKKMLKQFCTDHSFYSLEEFFTL
ncbi:hypothetical protein J6590_108310 [Homalodisca vitripennis]|nr:hypothetical protein J6590_108310 [Homalodisca vitripennis]